MKKILYLIVFLSGIAAAQNAVYNGAVSGPKGPVQFASVAVCTQPANTFTQPCSPLAALCSSLTDTGCTSPNPLTTDALGNFTFYLKPTLAPFTVQIYGAQVAASFVLTDQFGLGSPSVTGNNTFTGNNTLTAGQNAINSFVHNNVLWVGNGAAYKYSTLEAALAAPECTVNGCNITLVTGFRENVNCANSSVVIGNASGTPRFKIEAMTDVTLTATGVGVGSTPCFIVKEGSGFEGQAPGTIGSFPGRVEGFTLVDNRTGTVGPMVQSDIAAGSGGQGTMLMRNMFINGCFANCTYQNPARVVDIEQVLNQSVFENIKVCCASNATLFTVTSGPSREQGPILIDNLWTDCGLATGCQNVAIKSSASTASNSTLPIDISAGNQVGPGPNQPVILVDGSAVASIGAVHGVRIHTFIDNSAGSSANAAIGIKIVDAWNVDTSGTVMNAQNNDTMVDISETGAKKSENIHANTMTCISPSNGCTLLRNHITTYSTGAGILLPFYNYGTIDDTGQVAPFTIDGNRMMIGSTAPAAAQLHVISNASITNGLELDDTEGGGKNVVFGPGVVTASHVSVLDKSDSTELFFCFLQASGTCGVRGGLTSIVAGTGDLGSTALPFGNLWLGTAATNNFKFAPAATAAQRIINIPDPLGTTSLPLTIANGTKALNTASITTATCDAGVAATATGTLSTDTVDWSFNAAPTATNKYGAFLVVYAVPSTNTVTFYTCNPSATTSTPTAMTVNFSVRRP